MFSCGGFRPNLHPITSIRGVVLEWTKTTPRINVIECKFILPVTSIRGVFFAQIYILSIRGVVLELQENTPRINIIGCEFVHPVTSIRGVVFDQICILYGLFVGWFWSGKTPHD